MKLQFAAYFAAVLAITQVSRSRSLPQCREVNKERFPGCRRENFISTSVYLADDGYGYSEIMKNITAKLEDCSKYTDFMLCSLYVPRCQEKEAKPLLPCRDVCEAFVHDCGAKMNLAGLNWLKALCGLLGTNKTDPTCFKPNGFIAEAPFLPHCNQTVSSQICKRKLLKGSRTFIPSINQSEFQQNLSTALNTTVQRVGSPKCEETLKQLICSSYTPPCEGKTTMTLCLSKCDMLRDNCPKAFESFEVSSYCAEPADGNSDNGFCELKRWPSARHWDTDTPKTLLPQQFPVGLVAVLVLVPLMAVIFIYVGVAVRRRYEKKKSGYVQQHPTYTEPSTDPEINPTI